MLSATKKHSITLLIKNKPIDFSNFYEQIEQIWSTMLQRGFDGSKYYVPATDLSGPKQLYIHSNMYSQLSNSRGEGNKRGVKKFVNHKIKSMRGGTLQEINKPGGGRLC